MQYWYTYIDYLCSGIVSREAWRGVEHFAWTQALNSSGRIRIWRHTSTCRHHLLFCHQQWGLCLSAERHFSSQGSPGCIFGQVLLSFHRAAVYVLVFCHESCFRLLSFWWRTHECWPKPRTKEYRPPAIQNRLAQQLFFFFFVMVYSWRDFGKARTSWKIQCCPRVLPHMYRMKLAGNKLIPGAFGMSREEFSDRQASTISHWKSWGFAFESAVI